MLERMVWADIGYSPDPHWVKAKVIKYRTGATPTPGPVPQLWRGYGNVRRRR